VAHWPHGTLAPWHIGLMANWPHGTLALWRIGHMTHWTLGSLILLRWAPIFLLRMLRSWSCWGIDRDSVEFGQQVASLVSPKVLTGRARPRWLRLRERWCHPSRWQT